MAVISLKIVRFTNRNHCWKAKKFSYPKICEFFMHVNFLTVKFAEGREIFMFYNTCTLIWMVTLMIDSCCDCVKTSEGVKHGFPDFHFNVLCIGHPNAFIERMVKPIRKNWPPQGKPLLPPPTIYHLTPSCIFHRPAYYLMSKTVRLLAQRLHAYGTSTLLILPANKHWLLNVARRPYIHRCSSLINHNR